MKKIVKLAMALLCLTILLSGCTKIVEEDPNTIGQNPTPTPIVDLVPMVMVRDTLFYDLGSESDITHRCGVMDGEITSAVAASEIPALNDQSNFGIGYEYQFVDENNLDIIINNKWIRFTTR